MSYKRQNDISEGASMSKDAPKVKLQLFEAGYCKHPEWVTMQGGSLKAYRIPAIFACIEHPEAGYILFDTGYAGRFLQATDRLPNRLYRWITPVSFQEGDSAAQRLLARGILPEQIGKIIISHFHADHIAGLRDFPAAELHYAPNAYEAVRHLSGLPALRRAFLPELLPENFEERSRPLREEQEVELPLNVPFTSANDILGDGSLLAVDLPGHADGQIGLFLSTERHQYLLCADAAWSSRAYREKLPPNKLASLIMPDSEAYADSFQRLVILHERYPDLRIVPSHCPEVWADWILGGEPL
ncbi:MBL fold metallo-hydrolase [Paenibacillus eucommiae]|uniref:Glyoxylase-like metal-dependent hydrolase (Beta-lactamase superfamily II) n=1 Tax=Paenibacillus eucommiae TaxID=1355755 RepID=A0ABS4J062_9BACL|nr:MBL fold metallo-hydrolase [Paenibacillus eucommiae]MBP1993227.1 glyoxylase-like metal-dependent hydrolase (beta-lactamase superfamily II) [Paenibacillus eucommiae]